MRKSVIAILFLCLIAPQTSAQLWKMRRYEVSAGIGSAQIIGDIGGFNRNDAPVGLKNLSFPRTRFEINGSLRYRVTQDINVKLALTFARLSSSDARGSNPERGLESVTTLFEPAVTAEYYFVKNKSENSYLFSRGQRNTLGGIFKSLDIYAFTGLGGLSFSVTGNDKLQALNLKTSGFTAVIPVGVGTSFIFSPNLNFGADLGVRYPLTDYLDGYTSVYSKSNDFYFFLNLSITYKMKTGSKGLPSFRK